MKFLTAFLFLTLISVAFCKFYKVDVSLGSKSFSNIDGSVKLKIHGPNAADTFRLIKNTLKSGGTYTNRIEINYNMTQINKVSAYWTMTNPADPRWIFKKPVIYLRQVSLKDHLAENPPFVRNFRPANPDQALKPKQEVFLNLYSENDQD